MCVISLLVSFSPANRKLFFSCTLPHWQSASHKYGTSSCFLIQLFLPCNSVLASSTQKSFHASLNCLYPMFQREDCWCWLTESVSYIRELREAAWEPQLQASLLISPSFIDNVVHYFWEPKGSTTLLYHLINPSLLTFKSVKSLPHKRIKE